MQSEPKIKISIYLPAQNLQELDQHLMKTWGIIRNARSLFVIQAIREKLQRERKRKDKTCKR